MIPSTYCELRPDETMCFSPMCRVENGRCLAFFLGSPALPSPTEMGFSVSEMVYEPVSPFLPTAVNGYDR